MLRLQLSLRNSYLLVFSLLLVMLAGAGFIYISPGKPAVADAEPPLIRLLWSVPAAEAKSIDLADDGGCVALVAEGGTLDCYASGGRKLYSTKLDGADSAVVASSGEYVMAFSRLDPIDRRLTFLDGQGRVIWDTEVAGAVWSADAGSTRSGARFVVGTGERYIYVFDIGNKRHRYRRWRVAGAVTSAGLDPSAATVTYGTWQESAVGCATVTGNRRWQRTALPARLHYLDLLQSADRMMLRSVPNRFGADGDFALLDSTGRRIWQGTMNAHEDARVMCSPDGQYVCVGYNKLIQHEGKFVRERHAAFYDSTGRKLWDKGSMFLRAEPVFVTSKGHAVVCGGENMLFCVGPSGRMKSSIRLPAAVKTAVSSKDGSRVLLHCANGDLCMLGVTL